jgi:pimeloyl-ACP methyl ester carboxylesterase
MQPTINDYAKVFCELLDNLEINKVDLVGYATGSVIAASVAELCPSRVRRLVLFSAPVFTDEDRNTFQGRFGETIFPQHNGEHLVSLWKQVYDGRGPKQTPELCMHVFSEHIRASTEKKPWAPRAAFEHKLDQTLNKIKQPLVIYNLPNDVFEATSRSENYITNGSIFELENWGHGFLQTHTKEANTLIRKFFDPETPEVGL